MKNRPQSQPEVLHTRKWSASSLKWVQRIVTTSRRKKRCSQNSTDSRRRRAPTILTSTWVKFPTTLQGVSFSVPRVSKSTEQFWNFQPADCSSQSSTSSEGEANVRIPLEELKDLRIDQEMYRSNMESCTKLPVDQVRSPNPPGDEFLLS